MTAPPPQRAGSALSQAYTSCFATVRQHDHDLWLASLFWAAEARPHAQALLALAGEVARVRDMVTQPMLGEIRHQWWRDVIVNEAPAGNPVAEALIDTMRRFNLPKEPLLALIEAHAFDLYDDPMPSEAALDAYVSDTSAGLFEAIARVLAPGRLPAASVAAAGRAYGLTMLLRELPRQVMRGQLFLPLDLLERLKLPPETVLAHRNSPGLGLVLQMLRARVRVHLRDMQECLDGAGPGGGACLPAFLCEPYLRVMAKPTLNPFQTPIDVPPWRRQWALWRAARHL